MNLLEYEAKQILKQYNIPVPSGKVLRSASDAITTPIVLKSQVPTGGRGKLGGIRVIDDQSSVESVVRELLDKPIKKLLPSTILAEEKLEIKRELYLSILVNRDKETIELVAHNNGGTEVEDNNPASFSYIYLTDAPTNDHGEQLAEYFGLESHTFVLQDIIKNLYRTLVENDATLIEINPLILTNGDNLVAGDAKIALDDAASFRHLDWNFEAKPASANFVTLDRQGTVATIANGAGLAMATIDAVAAKGLQPANFLDIGGGANSQTVLAAFRKIQEFPNIQAIVINIFAGITRCDEVAKAIVAAKSEISDLPPLFIRLAGTNYQAAETLLNEQNIPLLPTLDDTIEAADGVING